MRDPFDALAEHLLRAGIRPRSVSRYVGELRDHLDDATDALTASGRPGPAARQEALDRLGTLDALALPMLANRRFRSLGSRAPWLFYAFGPLALYVATLAVIIAGLIGASSPGATPAWFGNAGATSQILASLILPVVGVWMICFAALRRRARFGWPLLGAVLMIAAAAAFQLDVRAPSPDLGGLIAIGVLLPSTQKLMLLSAFAAAALLPLLVFGPLGTKGAFR